jgi:predicted GH43/DUF377 family glycosyl hydrolase
MPVEDSTGKPTCLLDHNTSDFFCPEKSYERTRQVNNVCFLEGLAYFKGRWLIYYETSDSQIAVASPGP